MQTLKIYFENCYGIKRLEYDFDFSTKNIYAIYAPNGTMKTSFAKTMEDFSKNVQSKDLMFPLRTPIRTIHDETDSEIAKEAIFVIKPYDQKFKSQKHSTLLVQEDLKDRYDVIHIELEELKDSFLSVIADTSKLTKDLEHRISNSITSLPNNFFIALERIEREVLEETPVLYQDIKYTDIFDDKILGFLNTPDVRSNLSDYISKYNDLLKNSQYLKNGFNHYNAATIHKNLKDNGFFRAAHVIVLKNGESRLEINTAEELQTAIDEEKNRILDDETIKRLFKQIDDKIQKNAELRAFSDFLFQHQDLISKLVNPQAFEQELWINYIKTHKDLFIGLLAKYREGREEIAIIIEQARNEVTEWENAIEKFNTRFYVPFRLKVSNKDDVILNGQAPSVEFIFEENGQIATPKENELLEVLSQGEKRALYILNIIFEIEARRKQSQETVFVIDDIADSFDYKNKYAIIEYLKEISKVAYFYQIILTHNFDFFRTISSRLIGTNSPIDRKHNLYAMKTTNGIKLTPEKYQNKPFQNWIQNHNRHNNLIALIPFIRNITEYTNGIHNNSDYETLTDLLHIKSNTLNIRHQELTQIFHNVVPSIPVSTSTDKVIDIIYSSADNISQDTTHSEIDLEKKIVLSIAIRLRAEEFMIGKINNASIVNAISGNQTFELFAEYQNLFSAEINNIRSLEKVNLMTAENIHLNSFMYEPR